MKWLLVLFTDYTLRQVALGSALLGLVAGVLGCFAVLRRQSLVGDVLAHACLPGLCLAFLLTGTKDPLVLLLGAGLAAWVAAFLLLALLRTSRLGEDSALAVVLSGFFGLGVGLLTFIQHRNDSNQAGLDKFVFGQAATIVARDVALMGALAGLALALLALTYKELKLVTFDPDYAASLGLPVHALASLLTSLIVVAVMVGLQSVGVVLMAAMLIAPATAARQWTENFSSMVVLAGAFGLVSGALGALTSAARPHLPTGPLVVLAACSLTFLSLFFAPGRGLLWAYFRRRAHRRRIRLERLLLDAHVLYNHGILTPENLAARRGVSRARAAAELQELKGRGWVRGRGTEWLLTDQGHARAHELEAAMRALPSAEEVTVREVAR